MPRSYFIRPFYKNINLIRVLFLFK